MVEKLGRAKSIDVRDIPDLLKELEGRISTMTQTVNEEIQIVVGSVQVEDARIMKRQTEWTVVLAVLAAIYLPMSLVTGIFGMNITDLSADISAPDKWSGLGL
jgi:Mg2+ and Co2+ transporter CorA